MGDVQLCAGVHAVRVGDDLVFLDLGRDQYLCVPQARDVRLLEDGRTLRAPSSAPLEGFVDAGLATRSAAQVAGPARRLPRPSTDLAETDAGGGRLGGDFLRACADARLVYPRRSMADLVAFADDRRPGARPDETPGPDLTEAVRDFHAWAPWIPGPAKCLLRSFLLLRLLRRRGHDARWVFAVRTWPFGAHCWLQAGEVALDDAHERLAAFHPILVV